MVHVSLAAMVGSASARAVFVSLLFVATMFLATVASHAANEDDWFLDTVVDRRPHVDGVRPPAVIRPDGALSVDLSLAEFLEIQSLDEGDRRTRLGLPTTCIPGLTAMMRMASPSDQVTVMISCTRTTH